MPFMGLRQYAIQIASLVIGPGRRWRSLALLLCLLNWKNIPFVWHVRFYHAHLSHSLRRIRIPLPRSRDSPHPLFLPVITTSHTPLWECDVNLHKSNSTYFSDLDISRTHLMSLLLAPAADAYAERVRAGQETGKFSIILGSVACVFRREIKPGETYEIWTRVLGWEKKWCYVISHFVKKGSVRPRSYVMPGQGKGGWFATGSKEANHEAIEGTAAQEKYIFASAISKYVFKSGRKTIPPQTVWARAGLVPCQPVTDSDALTPATGGRDELEIGVRDDSVEKNNEGKLTIDAQNEGLEIKPPQHRKEAIEVERLLDESLEPRDRDHGVWTWEMVEQERIRGMELAQHMGALDGLVGEFKGNDGLALGRY